MKVCIISKYPPIEGGVSSETYWLAKALGEIGHQVFVVTNSWEVEEDYRERINKDELTNLEPKNVTVYSTTKDFKPPILKSNYYTEKLISLAIDVIRCKKVDVIYSHYILPYGIVGFVSKQVTKVPHVLRHAGSDMGNLYRSKFLQTVFLEAIKDANKVICGRNMIRVFKERMIDQDKIARTDWSVNSKYFNPNVKAFDISSYVKNSDIPVFTYIGKISKMKKTYAFVNAASKIKDKKFTLLFVVGDGPNVQELRKYLLSTDLKDKCVFLPFQPPWKIPSIMKASTCIVSPENEEPPPLQKGSHYPKIVREAMACGKCAIMGEGVSKKGLYRNLIDKENIMIVNPNDVDDFKKKLDYIIDNPRVAEDIGMNAYKFSKENEHFDNYVRYMESILYSVVKLS